MARTELLLLTYQNNWPKTPAMTCNIDVYHSGKHFCDVYNLKMQLMACDCLELKGFDKENAD